MAALGAPGHTGQMAPLGAQSTDTFPHCISLCMIWAVISDYVHQAWSFIPPDDLLFLTHVSQILPVFNDTQGRRTCHFEATALNKSNL